MGGPEDPRERGKGSGKREALEVFDREGGLDTLSSFVFSPSLLPSITPDQASPLLLDWLPLYTIS